MGPSIPSTGSGATACAEGAARSRRSQPRWCGPKRSSERTKGCACPGSTGTRASTPIRTCARCAAAPVAPAATDEGRASRRAARGLGPQARGGPMNEEGRKRWVLVGIMLSIFLAAIESTGVATAMPKGVSSLGGIRIYSWVFSGFLLTQTVTMALWGRFSDLYGRRSIYLAGLATFLAGSALSGAAQDMAQLVVFRMVQGAGAGALMTLGYTIIAELFGLERRARMQGYISGIWGLASLIGPWVGGVLTDHVSWRWVFYINLPFGAIAMAVIATALTVVERPVRRPIVDWAGVALLAAGVSAGPLRIVAAGPAGCASRIAVVALLALGAALLVAFVAVERRAVEPIVPPRLFRSRMVVAAVLTPFPARPALVWGLSFLLLVLPSGAGAPPTGGRPLPPPF